MIGETDAVRFRFGSFTDTGRRRFINIPPKPDDSGIGLPPHIDQRFQFLFRHTHIERTHRFQSANRTAVTQSQFGDFAFLPKMPVHAVLLDRHMKHLRCRSAVDVAAALKDTLSPAFTRDPRNHSRFDRREVGYKESAARFRNEGGADKFGKHQRNGVIQHFHHIEAAFPNESAYLLQIGQMVLRQILYLNEPPGVSACAVRAVELDKSPCAFVRADDRFHRRIFLDAALGEFLP